MTEENIVVLPYGDGVASHISLLEANVEPVLPYFPYSCPHLKMRWPPLVNLTLQLPSYKNKGNMISKVVK